MKLSITSILISSASIAIVSAQDIAFGTNKTLAPTPGIVRPNAPPPITPFPTEPPQPAPPIPTTAPPFNMCMPRLEQYSDTVAEVEVESLASLEVEDMDRQVIVRASRSKGCSSSKGSKGRYGHGGYGSSGDSDAKAGKESGGGYGGYRRKLYSGKASGGGYGGGYGSGSGSSKGGKSERTTGGDNGGQQHRHANFQYANRRLLVEEALRTVSMVVPPRRSNIIDNNDATIGTEDQQPQLGNDRMNGNEVRRRETRRGGGGWMRKRFLSFMGVTDDNNNTATPSSTIDTTTVDSNKRRYTLTCSMCHVDNPSIPYIASCGHCYCYICLRMAVTDDLSFRCLDCGQMIVSSSRVK